MRRKDRRFLSTSAGSRRDRASENKKQGRRHQRAGRREKSKPGARASASRYILPVLSLTLLLCGIGLLFVFESSVNESVQLVGHPYHFLQLQSLRLGLGLLGLITASLLPLGLWRRLAPVGFWLGIALMALTLIPGLGQELNGARRWLQLGPVFFQPVELFKFFLSFYYARWLSQHQRFAPFLFLTALPAALLLLQPDMGSLLIIVSICFLQFFVAGGKAEQLLLLGGGAVAGLGAAVAAAPYRLRRLQTFLQPDADPLGSGFHIKQITLALGSGSWLGLGLGASRQKQAYIPEVSTDSIFAIVAEELGFLGSSFIISLFFLLFWLLFAIAERQESGSFKQLLAIGIIAWLLSQTLLNLAAVVALVPLTGLPLPLFSYGGSSLIMSLTAIGIMLRIARSEG